MTFPDEISSSSTYSCIDLTLNRPSMSTFDLGDAVPNPISHPEVTSIAVPLEPITTVAAVTMPAFISPLDELLSL